MLLRSKIGSRTLKDWFEIHFLKYVGYKECCCAVIKWITDYTDFTVRSFQFTNMNAAVQKLFELVIYLFLLSV
jgi:hypothetical protein